MKATYVDHMGSDLSVVNAARVSFAKKSDWAPEAECPTDPHTGGKVPPFRRLKEGDARLIGFLARGCTTGDWEKILIDAACWSGGDEMELNELLRHVKNMPTHWTPFGHTAITLHIKAPLFVARQLGKHQVGFVWNEVSRRYVTDEPEFYKPVWRMKTENVKQGSGDEFPEDQQHWLNGGEDHNMKCLNYYQWLLDEGVAAEQARMVLPQNMYTEWYWTGNLYGYANLFIQRTDSHAQREIQEVAKQIGNIIKPLYPVSWEALTT